MACCPSSPRLCSRSSAYTLVLGLGFVTLGTSRLLLLKSSENAEKKYDFLLPSVNLLSEALKLLFCLVMSLRVIVREGRSCRELGFSSSSSFLSSLKWAIPAFLYFLDNLLIFHVISNLQPAVAALSSNFGILITAVLFRMVLKRRLSWVQWASLVILLLSIASLKTGSAPGGHSSPNSTVVSGAPLTPLTPLTTPSTSCLLYMQQMKNSSGGAWWLRSVPGPAWWSWTLEQMEGLGVGHVLILLQCFLSAMANIYNEKVLKEGDQISESIFIQNSKLYFFGVLFNALTLLLGSESRGVSSHCGLLHGYNVYTVVLVPVTAAMGLFVAFILKLRDNMFHVMTAQITTILVTVSSLLLFNFRPPLDFYLQATVVLLAIFIYNSSRPQDPESRLMRAKTRVINGEEYERSRGDGQEVEPLKPNTDTESDEESL